MRSPFVHHVAVRALVGVTAGLFRTGGSADAGLYGGSSYSNRPDTRGYMLQADWTPWGKESSWGQPWANLRLGLQYTGYRKFTFTVVGESACADSWGRALSTGEPSVSIPCYAERKFGGVQDDELLIALPPSYLPGLVAGLAQLDKNGLRYPIPSHGIQKSPLDSIEISYGKG